MKKGKILFIICLLMFLLVGCGKTQNTESEYSENEELHTEETQNTEDVEDTQSAEDSQDMTETGTENNAQESETEEETEEVGYTFMELDAVLVTTAKLNFRDLPSQDGTVINSIPKYTKVEVTGQCVETGWYRIVFRGVEGYASNEYVVDAGSLSMASGLNVAKDVSQIIIVSVDEMGIIDATVSMHTKLENGVWVEDYNTPGQIGRNGLGKEKEGDGKSPIGVYHFTSAFGILPDPGVNVFDYLQVDESHHWVDDPESKYYNQCVSTNDVEPDWNSTEHLCKYVGDYNYSLSTSYNEECVPYVGCAIFLHCTVKDYRPTSGCIAIPEEYMKYTLMNLKEDCIIILDLTENIGNY